MALWLNAKRVARYGLIGFIRNGFVSLSAIFIMTITLLVVSALLISGAALNAVLADLTNKVDITVYFLPGAGQSQVDDMKKDLESLPEVASVTYESPDQALTQFRERHKGDQIELQALDLLSSNPFGAALEIRARQTSQYESVAKYISDRQKSDQALATAIYDVNFYQNKTAIDRLTAIIEMSERIGAALAIILGLASLLIAFNTVRLAIYTARDEIGVMNIVGAGHWYVRGPFMIAGILYGTVSGLIVILILYPLTAWLGPASQDFFGNFNVFTYFIDSFPFLFFVIMASGITLGALSSYLAIRRYLYT
ncbi:MAG: permease-like cell division protein FtsX [bacterium]|nr:permease-like cell division protein FtsX [bacterium]